MTDLLRRLPWLAPALLLVFLALATLPSTGAALRLAGGPDAADGVIGVLDELPADALVLVGFDADLGTYAEIRPTVRTLLDDLVARDARLVFVSLTPEGRALAVAERQRLVAGGVEVERLADAGFVPGAEAAIVRIASAVSGDGGALVSGIGEEHIALGLIVGGNDIGPRSWVEQFLTRVEGAELMAVAPAVLLPELQPYLESGQLRALIATPRDGAAYRDSSDVADVADVAGPSPLAVLAGMLVAIGVLGGAVATRVGGVLPGPREGETA
jgi:hypothetical protein